MLKKLANTFRFFICGVLVLQFSGCGTILYPERKGQRAGRIDAGVALLDGIGLLFFLIPGVIAFAVDFNNGTIYLPGTSAGALDLNDIKHVKFGEKPRSLASVEKIIGEQTGYVIQLNHPDVQMTRLESTNDLRLQFGQIQPEPRDDRMAQIR